MSQASSLHLVEQGRQVNPPSSLSQPDNRHNLVLLDLNFNVQVVMIHYIAWRHFNLKKKKKIGKWLIQIQLFYEELFVSMFIFFSIYLRFPLHITLQSRTSNKPQDIWPLGVACCKTWNIVRELYTGILELKQEVMMRCDGNKDGPSGSELSCQIRRLKTQPSYRHL